MTITTWYTSPEENKRNSYLFSDEAKAGMKAAYDNADSGKVTEAFVTFFNEMFDAIPELYDLSIADSMTIRNDLWNDVGNVYSTFDTSTYGEIQTHFNEAMRTVVSERASAMHETNSPNAASLISRVRKYLPSGEEDVSDVSALTAKIATSLLDEKKVIETVLLLDGVGAGVTGQTAAMKLYAAKRSLANELGIETFAITVDNPIIQAASIENEAILDLLRQAIDAIPGGS